MRTILVLLSLVFAFSANATNDYLVQVKPEAKSSFMMQMQASGSQVEDLKLNNWMRVKTTSQSLKAMQTLTSSSAILHVQPNYKIKLFDNPSLDKNKQVGEIEINATDNPAIPKNVKSGTGPDPLFNKQWGMNDIGVKEAWQISKGNKDLVVAVIDTGVDYTHEDLVENLWRNPGEVGTDSQGRDKSSNGIDDDGNGYVDDVIGWDFVSNDNKPYDKTGNIFQGGNPGHGTHCAGNVAARGNNGKGISGVAPNIRIMSLRFISDKGQGTTADAIKAVRYAVDNGAIITSNSWGSVGEDPNDAVGNQALRDAVQYSQDKGVLFIAAAGNGHRGIGYDNDTDSRPTYPASYKHDIIISVAAIDSANNLGSFSNWGRNTVDIGAPGVKVFSTTVGNKYSDSVLAGLATWDGTSMAAPHVAGAAALYYSKHPNATWRDVKSAIISSAAKLSNLNQKTVSGGKLDVKALMQQ